MSSATAPARASSRQHHPAGRLAGPLRLPGDHLLPPRLRDGGPGRLRADHGAVRLGDRVDRLAKTSSPTRSSSARPCFAVIGAVALVVASRMSVGAWKRLALPILVVGFVLQLLVLTPLGTNVGGNQNWIAGRPGHRAAVRDRQGRAGAHRRRSSCRRSASSLHSLSHVSCPTSSRSPAVSIAVVALGHDLGTVLILGAIVAGVLFAAGIPLRWFAFAGGPFIADGHRVRRHQPQPAGPLRRLAGPRHRRVRRGAPADPRPLRPGRRWLVRARPRGQPREVGSALRAAQRLHLRDHRRGARAARHHRHPAALRRPRPGLLPPRHPHRRPLRAHRDGRHHDLDASSRR